MNYVRYFSRAVLLIMAIFWFGFALLSGAGDPYDAGLIQNIPNALPWLLLFILVYVAWKWELAGGILVTAAGICTIFFFNAFESPVVLFFISLPLIALGAMFFVSSRLGKN